MPVLVHYEAVINYLSSAPLLIYTKSFTN